MKRNRAFILVPVLLIMLQLSSCTSTPQGDGVTLYYVQGSKLYESVCTALKSEFSGVSITAFESSEAMDARLSTELIAG